VTVRREVTVPLLRFIAFAFGIILVASGTYFLLRSTETGGPGSVLVGNDERVTREYVIAPGTGERIRQGENIEVLPASITFQVGDTIRIRNDDTEGSVVGPFYVHAHSVMTQRFTSPGTYSGLCTVHPSGEIELVVHQ
jgi:plastocyanin